MATKKNTNEKERCWIVVGSNGQIESRPTLLTAMNLAKESKLIYENEEWYVFEITKSWVIEISEPKAEEFEIGFDGLP